MHHIFSVDKHTPMNQSQWQVVQEHEKVTVEETYKSYECMDVDLIRDPLGHLIGQVEGFNESLIHVIVREIEVQRA